MRSSSTTLLLAALCLLPIAGIAQNDTSSQDESTITGEVVSSTRNTMVIRTDNGRDQLFTFNRDTTRPRTIPVGSQVRVSSIPGEDSAYRVARNVTVVSGAPARQQGTAAQTAPAVPPSVRRVENQISRQARRYGAGVQAGLALDPELIMVGVHARVGPFFNQSFTVRPGVEFDWGEVTSLFGLNLEGIYRLPVNSALGRWSTYAGVGPGFNFIHQNFHPGQGSRIDFGDFRYSTALNILGGIQYRSGMFVELKSSVYASPAPTLRLMIGYNF